MAKKDFTSLAHSLLPLIGGKDNISLFTHCVTRLRFNVKDKGLVNHEEITKIQGVIGAQWSGEQFQIIIGNDVEEVYNSCCQLAGLQKQETIHENLDETGNRFSLKRCGEKLIAYISPIMLSILPMMIAASMCKTLGVLLGPSMLNVIQETHDLYILLDLLYDTFFYFLPIYLGYSACKGLMINPLYGIFLGAMILSPKWMAMISVRESFRVFGIGAPIANYSQTFLPVILGVFLMSYVIQFLEKYIPHAVKSVFVPTLTVLIMAPVMFCVCGPLGSWVGTFIGNLFIALAQSNIIVRVLGSVILAVALPYMVLTGMHGVLVNFAIMTFFANGFESYVLPTMIAYNWAVHGVGLGVSLKLKNSENKAAAFGLFISNFLGGVTEPVLYGTILKYKNAMKALLVACAIGGVFCGIMQPEVYALVSASLFTIWAPWPAGGNSNLIIGLIATLLPFVVGVIAAYIVKYDAEA